MEDKKNSHGEFQHKYGKGFEIIRKMGFKGGGLGVDGTGISEPIVIKSGKNSIGVQPERRCKADEVNSLIELNEDSEDSKLENKKMKLNLRKKIEIEEGFLDEILELILSFRDEISAKRNDLKASLGECETEIESREEATKNLVRRKEILENLNVITNRLNKCFIDFNHKIESVSDCEELTSLFEENSDKEVININSNKSEYNKISIIGEAVEELIKEVNDIFSGFKDNYSIETSKSYLPYSKIIKDILEDILYKMYVKNWNLKNDPEYGTNMWISIKTLFILFENNRPDEEVDYNSKHCYEQLVITIIGKSLEDYYLYYWDPVKETNFGLCVLQIWDNIIPDEYVRTRLLEEVIWKKQSQKLQLKINKTGNEELNVLEHKWLFVWLPYYHKHGSGYFIAKLMSKHIEMALNIWEPPEIWPITLLSMWKPVLESNNILLNNISADEYINTGSEHIEYADETNNEFTYLILSIIYPKLSAYLENNLTIKKDYKLQNLFSIDYLDEWLKEDLLDRFLVSQLFVEVIGPKWLTCLNEKLSDFKSEYNARITGKSDNCCTDEHVYDVDMNNFDSNIVKDVGSVTEEKNGNGNMDKFEYICGNLNDVNSRFSDILNWYEYWRTVFSKRVMISSRTKVFLTRGLVMIDFYINYYSDHIYDDETSTNKWIDYDTLEKSCKVKNSNNNNPSNWEDSFVLGLLEWVSSETGLVLKPSNRRDVAYGKRIYSIENSGCTVNNKVKSDYFTIRDTKLRHLFYIGDGVIYFLEKSASNDKFEDSLWKPISIISFIRKFGVEMNMQRN
ncbi:hypothetical protein RS030_111971 [Cryptosporidium xiaoi]|uniref:G-patch domain-containing protein n=1 Tax=Cryptosporidium xiaoi TaxID=659607 RepID=A0AAV9Y2I2_9CRYT